MWVHCQRCSRATHRRVSWRRVCIKPGLSGRPALSSVAPVFVSVVVRKTSPLLSLVTASRWKLKFATRLRVFVRVSGKSGVLGLPALRTAVYKLLTLVLESTPPLSCVCRSSDSFIAAINGGADCVGEDTESEVCVCVVAVIVHLPGMPHSVLRRGLCSLSMVLLE